MTSMTLALHQRTLWHSMIFNPNLPKTSILTILRQSLMFRHSTILKISKKNHQSLTLILKTLIKRMKLILIMGLSLDKGQILAGLKRIDSRICQVLRLLEILTRSKTWKVLLISRKANLILIHLGVRNLILLEL